MAERAGTTSPGYTQVLVTEMQAVATVSAGLVITGEPDVGKPALSLRAASQLSEAGTPVVS